MNGFTFHLFSPTQSRLFEKKEKKTMAIQYFKKNKLRGINQNWGNLPRIGSRPLALTDKRIIYWMKCTVNYMPTPLKTGYCYL